MLINVDCTVTYFFPIRTTVPRTRARSELLIVSLVLPHTCRINLWLLIKTLPGPFWGKHGRLVAALE